MVTGVPHVFDNDNQFVPTEKQDAKYSYKVPVKHRPAFGSVVVLGEYSPELPLGEKLYYLCENEYPCMHICSDY